MPGKLVWEAETAQISFQASMVGPELAGQTKTPPYQKVSTVGRHLLTAVAQRSHRINLPGGKCAKSLMMWFPSGNRGALLAGIKGWTCYGHLCTRNTKVADSSLCWRMCGHVWYNDSLDSAGNQQRDSRGSHESTDLLPKVPA